MMAEILGGIILSALAVMGLIWILQKGSRGAIKEIKGFRIALLIDENCEYLDLITESLIKDYGYDRVMMVDCGMNEEQKKAAKLLERHGDAEYLESIDCLKMMNSSIIH